MRRLLILLGVLCLSACSSGRYNTPLKLDVAIDQSGIVEDYTFDMSKPKVMTYFGTLDVFRYWLSECTPKRLSEYKEAYPNVEFIFYLRAKGDEELQRAIAIAKKHGVESPIYIDSEDKFQKANIGVGCTMVSSIVGADNKYYDCAVVGMKLSPFDEVMRSAVKRIEEDRNGL